MRENGPKGAFEPLKGAGRAGQYNQEMQENECTEGQGISKKQEAGLIQSVVS